MTDRKGFLLIQKGPLLALLFGFLTLVFWYQINIRPAEWWPNLFFFFFYK